MSCKCYKRCKQLYTSVDATFLPPDAKHFIIWKTYNKISKQLVKFPWIFHDLDILYVIREFYYNEIDILMIWLHFNLFLLGYVDVLISYTTTAVKDEKMWRQKKYPR